MKLKLNATSLRDIRKHLEESYPYEGCGFLLGKEGEEREVVVSIPAKNIKSGDQRRRFEIDPLEYMNAERLAETMNLNFLGIYHSHPDHPAIPSAHDLLQAVPVFSYVIASIRSGFTHDITSWRLGNKGQFDQEEVEYKSLEFNKAHLQHA